MRTDVKVVSVCIVILILGAISVRIWFIVSPPQLPLAAPVEQPGDWVKLKFHYELAVPSPTPPGLEALTVDITNQRLKSITAQTQVHSAGSNEIEVWLSCSPQFRKVLAENAAARNLPHSGLLFEKLTPQMQTAQDAIAAAKTAQDVDPADIIHLLATGGLLEFRIAVSPEDLGGTDDAQYLKALHDLKTSGPINPVHANDTAMHWSPIDPAHLDDFLRRPTFVTADWSGKTYILLYDELNRTLIHNRKPDWMITAGTPTHFDDQLVLPFSLDTVGGSYMGDLTAANIGRPLGILLDDQLISAPSIHTSIRDQGEISFHDDPLSEVQLLRAVLNAGASPIRYRFLALTP